MTPLLVSHSSGATRIGVIGLGCRAECSADALRALVEALLDRYGLDAADIDRLATIAHRRHAPAILALASALERPLEAFEIDALARERRRILTSSPVVTARLGIANVAESAALVAAGSSARLAGPRLANRWATAALAIRPAPGQAVGHAVDRRNDDVFGRPVK